MDQFYVVAPGKALDDMMMLNNNNNYILNSETPS